MGGCDHGKRDESMKIGIIGAGMIGSTVGKLWVDAGHEVFFASRHPEELKPLVAKLGKRASAGTPAEAARFGEVIMLTVPLAAVPDLARDVASSLKGKVVLDTGNAYEKRDGDVARKASAHPQGSAGWAASMFPGARWVKAFNTVTSKRSTRKRIAMATKSAFRWQAMIARRSMSPRSWCATPALIQSLSDRSHAGKNSSLIQRCTTAA
jgi:predicted dinucleotide-binding enzyme